jgi:predicted phage terminase large subunit-like protein
MPDAGHDTAMQRRLFEIKRELWARQCRRNLYAFCIEALAPLGERPERHHRRIIAELEAVARGKNLRLMIVAPPGSAKTTYTSRLFPAWYFASRANTAIIGASHTDELAVTNSGYVQRFVRDNGDVLGFDRASEAAGNWITTNGCRYRAVGVGGAITGFRADVAIIDDPIRGRQDAESVASREALWNWFNADLATRLKPNGCIVLIMTRYHEDDLAGRLLRLESERWRVLKLPAIAEMDDPLGRQEGEPLWNDGPYGYGRKLLELRDLHERNGLLRDWWSLYQGEPRPPEGAMFKPAEMPVLDVLPDAIGGFAVRAWDLASSVTGDWTVGLRLEVVKEGKHSVGWVISDVRRMRRRPDEVRRLVQTVAESDGRGVKVLLPEDPGQAGKDQAQDYVRRLVGFRVVAERMTGDKVTRADAVASQCNIGRIGMVRAGWNAVLIDELGSFPLGVHDDIVDALSLAFSGMARRPPMRISAEAVENLSRLPPVRRQAVFFR